MSRFWNYEDGNVLRMYGPIDSETWYGDEVTPSAFAADLAAHPGDILLYLNSPGGDIIAATQIYQMIRDHKGKVTVRIDGLAASAASIVAMAGDVVQIAPTGYIMIHLASSAAWGNTHEMAATARMLSEVDEGIALAYEDKTGLNREEILDLMDGETWLNAQSALDLGFVDEILFRQEKEDAGTRARTQRKAAALLPPKAERPAAALSRVVFGAAGQRARLMARLAASAPPEPNASTSEPEKPTASAPQDDGRAFAELRLWLASQA